MFVVVRRARDEVFPLSKRRKGGGDTRVVGGNAGGGDEFTGKPRAAPREKPREKDSFSVHNSFNYPWQ